VALKKMLESLMWGRVFLIRSLLTDQRDFNKIWSLSWRISDGERRFGTLKNFRNRRTLYNVIKDFLPDYMPSSPFFFVE
jgi:hypothetical protein